MPADKIIQHRQGIASLWTSTNPVLAIGEIGYETDTGKFKFGDGTSSWTVLSYAVPTSSVSDSFATIAVSGQDSIVADSSTDTLTFVAGSNVTITTDAASDSITIAATDTNTTYTAGTGLTLSGTEFQNTGVTSVNSVTGAVSATNLLDAIKTVDGTGSGLDADTLDGNDSSAFATASHTHAIDDLSDVTITTPSSGQVLKYNGSAWVNDTDSTGSGGITTGKAIAIAMIFG